MKMNEIGHRGVRQLLRHNILSKEKNSMHRNDQFVSGTNLKLIWLSATSDVFCGESTCASSNITPFAPTTHNNACQYDCKYVNHKDSTAMLTAKTSAGVTPEVILGITHR